MTRQGVRQWVHPSLKKRDMEKIPLAMTEKGWLFNSLVQFRLKAMNQALTNQNKNKNYMP